MAFDITEFKKHGIGDNPPRACLFKVEINDDHRIPFLCYSFTENNSIEFGLELNLKFYEDATLYVEKFLQSIDNNSSVNLIFTQYNKDGTILQTTEYPNCKLVSTKVNFDWEANTLLIREATFYHL